MYGHTHSNTTELFETRKSRKEFGIWRSTTRLPHEISSWTYRVLLPFGVLQLCCWMHVVSHQANWIGETALIYPKSYEFETRKRKGLWSSLVIFESRNCWFFFRCNREFNFFSCSRMDSDAHQWIVFFSPDSNPWYVAVIELAMHPGNREEQCWRKNPYHKGPIFRLSDSASESTLVQALNLKPSLPFNGFWPF
jgi:hypothetical protein